MSRSKIQSPIGREHPIELKNLHEFAAGGREQSMLRAFFVATVLAAAFCRPAPLLAEQAAPQAESYQQFMAQLRHSDKCGTVYMSKLHGYDLREYKLTTKDNYELVLHRLIHPAEIIARRAGKRVEKKKPYLLLHGILGTSGSFVNNVKPLSMAPADTLDLSEQLGAMLRSTRDKFEHLYECTACRFRGQHDQDKPDKWASGERVHPKFATCAELNFENDPTPFASAFRQAHRKFHLPKEALKFTSNSLAFTLSNFGYDVWMINMRGNHYSRGYNGRLSSVHAEYWNFDISTLVREDLLASIDFIKRENACSEPIGLVSYSYGAINVLNLLRKFPIQLKAVEPVIMIAPTLLTANSNPDKVKRAALRTVSKVLVARNGPFPSLGRATTARTSSFEKIESTVEKVLCKLPVFSKFCRFFETVLYGRTKRVTSVKRLLLSDSQEQLVRRENDCSQTSSAILHQIMDHLSTASILPDYSPQLNLISMQARKETYKRTVILVHSRGDEISTPAEVDKIREYALRELTLVDYLVESDKFGHTDFLFAAQNQYLVNAEIARMAVIYDYLLYRPHMQTMLSPRTSSRFAGPPR